MRQLLWFLMAALSAFATAILFWASGYIATWDEHVVKRFLLGFPIFVTAVLSLHVTIETGKVILLMFGIG